MDIDDAKVNNDDTGGGEHDNSERNTIWSPGGQLPKCENSERNTSPNARLPQSSDVHSEKLLFGENGKVRPSGQQRSESKKPNALSGSSAPSPEDEETWAKEIIAEAQLVSTRVLQI